MEDVKCCQMCGCVISDANNPDTDYYRHIRLQYCPSCRKLSDNLKTAARVKALRQRKRQRDKYRDEQLQLLQEENRLLRIRVQQLREETNKKY